MTDDELDKITETTICGACGIAFDYQPYTLGIRFNRTTCQPCAEHAWQEQQSREKAAIETANEAQAKLRHAARWDELCPMLFRDTDASRLPVALITAVVQWEPTGKQSIGLIGQSGAGKTRAGFLTIQKAHDAGLICESISHSKLAQTARDAAFGKDCEAARERMNELETCDVLFVDDIGKPPSTERADADFEALIDHRHSHCLPIIWTANGGGSWLSSRFGPDRGDPIVRRLTQDALIVKI